MLPLLTNSEKENASQGQELNKIEINPKFVIKNIFKFVKCFTIPRMFAKYFRHTF